MVDNPQEVILGGIKPCGLHIVKESFGSEMGNELCLSLKEGRFVRVAPIFNNGELNLSGFLFPLDRVSQLPCDMIEATAKVVDYFPGPDTKCEGDLSFLGVLLEALPGITLTLRDDALPVFNFDFDKWKRLKELGYSKVQVLDILIGD